MPKTTPAKKGAKSAPTPRIEVRIPLEFRPWEVVAAHSYYRSGTFALDSVFIDPAGYAVASDGTVMVIVPAKLSRTPPDWKGALVPPEVLKDTVAAYKKPYNYDSAYRDNGSMYHDPRKQVQAPTDKELLALRFGRMQEPLLVIDVDAKTVTAETKRGMVTAPLPTGTYPRWRTHLIPKKLLGRDVGPSFSIPRLAKLGRALGLDSAMLHLVPRSKSGSAPHLLPGPLTAFGLLAPVIDYPAPSAVFWTGYTKLQKEGAAITAQILAETERRRKEIEAERKRQEEQRQSGADAFRAKREAEQALDEEAENPAEPQDDGDDQDDALDGEEEEVEAAA